MWLSNQQALSNLRVLGLLREPRMKPRTHQIQSTNSITNVLTSEGGAHGCLSYLPPFVLTNWPPFVLTKWPPFVLTNCVPKVMGERVDEARAAGKVLRYKFSIDLAKGSAECGIVAVDDKV